jgi:hypothetical protein
VCAENSQEIIEKHQKNQTYAQPGLARVFFSGEEDFFFEEEENDSRA